MIYMSVLVYIFRILMNFQPFSHASISCSVLLIQLCNNVVSLTFFSILLQIAYFTVDITVTTHEYLLLKDVPIATWILATVWMVAVIPLHEFVKKHEAR